MNKINNKKGQLYLGKYNSLLSIVFYLLSFCLIYSLLSNIFFQFFVTNSYFHTTKK